MRFLTITLSLLCMVLTAEAARADRRVAFVVGNGAYKSVAQLPNPPVDAWMLPEGGVHITNRAPEGWQYTEGARKELLW